MSAQILTPFIDVFQLSLKPIAPFTWFGLGLSSLDLLATVRLCVALRQLREDITSKQLKIASAKKTKLEIEEKSFVKDLSTTLMVVYGGETMSCTSILRNVLWT